MRFTYSNPEFGKTEAIANTENKHSERARKNRLKEFHDQFLDSVKETKHVIAIAVGATLLAYGCSFNTMGRYKTEDADSDTEMEVEPDLPDEVDITEVPDAESDGDVEIDVEPACFEIPAPLDPNVDPVLNNPSDEEVVFTGPDSGAIETKVYKNVSMTGYPPIVLGECPDDPYAVAFIGSHTRTYTLTYDASVIAGIDAWSATVPDAQGTLCPSLTEDSEALISHNNNEQQVPKNALMSDVPTQAGFTLQGIDASMVAYEVDASVESTGSVTLDGGNLESASTVKAIILFGDMRVEVEVPAGASSDVHGYSTPLTMAESKEARLYPTAIVDNQMYDIVWDESERIWCARCESHESFNLEVLGDILCKVLDSCGCVGDGMTITVTSVTLDKSATHPDIQGYYEEADPPVRSASGVSALSDPSTSHPSVSATFEKNMTGGIMDSGQIARMTAVIEVEVVSEHENIEGGHDVITYIIRVPIVDPKAYGTSESPNYTEDCGCTPVV